MQRRLGLLDADRGIGCPLPSCSSASNMPKARIVPSDMFWAWKYRASSAPWRLLTELRRLAQPEGDLRHVDHPRNDAAEIRERRCFRWARVDDRGTGLGCAMALQEEIPGILRLQLPHHMGFGLSEPIEGRGASNTTRNGSCPAAFTRNKRSDDGGATPSTARNRRTSPTFHHELGPGPGSSSSRRLGRGGASRASPSTPLAAAATSRRHVPAHVIGPELEANSEVC